MGADDPSGEESNRSGWITYPEKLQFDELKILLEGGADPNFPVCVPGSSPLSGLVKAFNKPDADRSAIKETIKLMLKHGANPMKQSEFAENPAAGDSPDDCAMAIATNTGADDLVVLFRESMEGGQTKVGALNQ